MPLTSVALRPLLDFCAGLKLDKPEEAQCQLEAEFPFSGKFICDLGAALQAGLGNGDLCDQGAPPMQWSRLFRPAEDTCDFSADVVCMNGAGPFHEHPAGEIDLAFALEGDPTFDGRPPGWILYGPGSRHVPTVEGGKMIILYLLPGGQFRFLKSE